MLRILRKRFEENSNPKDRVRVIVILEKWFKIRKYGIDLFSEPTLIESTTQFLKLIETQGHPTLAQKLHSEFTKDPRSFSSNSLIPTKSTFPLTTLIGFSFFKNSFYSFSLHFLFFLNNYRKYHHNGFNHNRFFFLYF